MLNSVHPIIGKTNVIDLQSGIANLLPESGVVKVVNELPLERNPTHMHENEETLLILTGSLQLFWEIDGVEDFVEAYPSEKIFLPKSIKHYSVAGDTGCFYLITDRFVL